MRVAAQDAPPGATPLGSGLGSGLGLALGLGLGLGFGLAESCPSMIALDAGSVSASTACAQTSRSLRPAVLSSTSPLDPWHRYATDVKRQLWSAGTL